MKKTTTLELTVADINEAISWWVKFKHNLVTSGNPHYMLGMEDDPDDWRAALPQHPVLRGATVVASDTSTTVDTWREIDIMEGNRG